MRKLDIFAHFWHLFSRDFEKDTAQNKLTALKMFKISGLARVTEIWQYRHKSN